MHSPPSSAFPPSMYRQAQCLGDVFGRFSFPTQEWTGKSAVCIIVRSDPATSTIHQDRSRSSTLAYVLTYRYSRIRHTRLYDLSNVVLCERMSKEAIPLLAALLSDSYSGAVVAVSVGRPRCVSEPLFTPFPQNLVRAMASCLTTALQGHTSISRATF